MNYSPILQRPLLFPETTIALCSLFFEPLYSKVQSQFPAAALPEQFPLIYIIAASTMLAAVPAAVARSAPFRV